MGFFGQFFKNQIDVKLQDLFGQQATTIVSGAEQLQQFFNDLRQGESTMQRIVELEHQGDQLTQQIHTVLDRAFITSWLDKSDATHLANQLDNFLDAMRAVARCTRLYSLALVPAEAVEFTQIILQLSLLVKQLVVDLRQKDFSAVNDHHRQISLLEQKGDDLRDRAINRLCQEQHWESPPLSLIDFFLWKEIIEGLEKVTDRGHHIAQIILSISRKAH